MKNVWVVFIVLCFNLFGQNSSTFIVPESSMLKKLGTGDSLTYYQCHVEEAIQQMTTASGQTLTGKSQKYSITEKYVLYKTEQGYRANYYTSSLNVFPNRKFSGLKIRERPYWNFKKEKNLDLTEQDIKILLALENKGRQAIEYDYVINKYNTNQVIIKQRKDFRQLVIDGNHIISKLIIH